MKQIIFILLVCIPCSFSVIAQSRNTEKLLTQGVELNDLVKINSALSNGAKPDDGLIKSIKLKNMELVRFFIERGADPTQAIKEAVIHNNIDIVEYLLEKGTNYQKEKVKNIDGPVYFQVYKGGALIPIYYLKGGWMVKNPNGTYSNVGSMMNEASNFVYNTKEIILGNSSLISAIDNSNLQMIQLLVNHGFNAKDSCVIEKFDGLVPPNGTVTSNYAPTPALVMRPIEYAISKNANSSIVELLQKIDDTKSYRFDFEKVSFIYENNSDNFLKIENNDLSVICTKKAKKENIFGVKLFYSTDNSDFKEIKFIGFPLDSTNYVTRYFYNVFGDSIHPKEIIIKIDINSYGCFIDTRNGEQYRTVKIGNQEIMAENFRFKTDDGCWIYNNDSKNLKENGYLFTEEAAKLIAPKGWHLPSSAEWDELYVYCNNDLQSLIDALFCGGGTGFDLKLSGIHSMFGYSNMGSVAVFRCSEPHSNINFNIHPGIMGFWAATSFHLYETNHAKCGFSVRLFKDK
jgi:uncharacterized protein (TIGR02145 family)